MRLETFAKKTFVALKNPFNTVKSVNALAIDKVEQSFAKNNRAYYMGIKDTNVIPDSLISKMQDKGFLYHTKDVMSYGGRAIDINLKNPLTGSFMSGSSSGSALNVFYAINDLAIASDGGGSVLAPAASLNLYSLISPLIESGYVKQFNKTSTDGISFSPSIGFITREFEELKQAFESIFPLNSNCKNTEVLITDKSLEGIYKTSFDFLSEKLRSSGINIKTIKSPNIFDSRKDLISFLNQENLKNSLIISIEGAIDVNGIGDTIFGHFDERTKAIQQAGGKGFLRVVNMCKKSAIGIPMQDLAISAFIICESDISEISKAFHIAQIIKTYRSKIVENYFSKLEMYL
ncbi:MAG: hypothetical protein LBV66_03585 [Elusimicrobiota bacterium]|jgi:hypothetical protein|nr:hypothetical protein [Elusimicrobiota bacterium]